MSDKELEAESLNQQASTDGLSQDCLLFQNIMTQ
jgi:hypothetical protein